MNVEGVGRRPAGRVLWLFVCLVWALLSSVSVPAQAQEAEGERKRIWYVGVVIDGPSQRMDELRKAMMREIRGLAGGEFAVKFKTRHRLTGDWTADTIQKHIDQHLQDEEVDLVIGFGPIASHLLTQVPELDKPALAPFVVDEAAQGLVGPNGKPKRKTNLSYVLWSLDLERDFKTFREFGDFKRVGFVTNAYVAQAIPKLGGSLKASAKKLKVEAVPILAERDAESAIRGIPKDIDAVYVGPNPQLDMKEIEKLAAHLNERRLPSFSWFGKAEVRRGLLVGVGSPQDFERLSRRIALNLQAIMLGEPPETLAKAFQLQEAPVINMSTARAVGVWPNWGLITEAELLNNSRKKISRKLSLSRAVKEAMKSNLDIKLAKQRLYTNKQNIAAARANLLPRLEVGVTGSWIDSDRAGFGNPERAVFWTGSLSQNVYNERVYANLKVQKHLQKSLKHDRETVRLDVVRNVTVAYLSVLKAKTFERIQRDNLDLSRNNLSLARVRLAIGSANKSEVLRWESAIASARSSLILAASQRNQAEIQLNQLLNRPLEEPFVTREASVNDPVLISAEKRFKAYLNNPYRFKVLREFMAAEAINNAPELKSLGAAIRAKKREIKSNKRAYYLPKVGVSGSVTNRFIKDGAGTDGIDTSGIPPQFQGALSSIPNPDDLDWQVGISATLPLYEGGARYAATRKSQRELTELTIQKKAIKQGVEARVRVALHRAGASFPAIRLSRDAANAAEENLKLVTDAYSRGTASIIQLLDAQNQALVAEQSAANAVFDFLIDLMDVERAVGRFDFFQTRKSTERFFSRLDARARQRAAKDNVTLPGDKGQDRGAKK